MQALPFIPAALSTVGSLMGMAKGSPADKVQLPPQWQMPNRTEAAQQAFGGIQDLGQYNYAAGVAPQFQSTVQGLYNAPGSQQFMQGANAASGMGQAGALNQFGTGQQMTGMGQNIYPYASALMDMGFDPQDALYGRTAQRLQDQIRATQGARGIAMTPYGAGLENQAMSNFNIDWQNTQLGRAMQGLQGGAGAMGQAGQLMGAGQNLASAAPGQYLTASGMPYATGQMIGGNQLGALQQLGQFGQMAASIPQMQIGDWLNYVNAGNQAGQVANQTAQLGLNQANLGFNQGQTMGANLGAGLQGLSSAYGKYGNPFAGFGGSSNPYVGNYGPTLPGWGG